MGDINVVIEKFINLPPFTNSVEAAADVEASVAETFHALGLTHSTFLCRRAILNSSKARNEWDRMLFVDTKNDQPILAFFATFPDSDTIFIDCYGNYFVNEVKLLQSHFCSSYYRYYNTKKIFTLSVFESSEEYLKDLMQMYK